MTPTRWWHRFGPGFLVTAAFIGPGTVTTATVAGDRFGLALWWTIPFAVLTACVLQEMAARLGLVTRRGLGEAIRELEVPAFWRRAGILLVLAAILIGNAAYQAGNLTGAAIGLQQVVGIPGEWGVVVAAGLAVGLVLLGAYRSLQAALVGLVAIMSAVFVATAIGSRPALADWPLSISIPEGSLPLVLALVGTTVVPYNLFLHARIVQEKWRGSGSELGAQLTSARWDTVLAIVVGGMVTLAILVTAAMTFHGRGLELSHPAETAGQLEMVIGSAGRRLFSLGLFAAGLTSSITAPLAAAYATCGCTGMSSEMKSRPFRLVAVSVMLVGLVAALVMGGSPQAVILFAQTANGVLLPVVACFLLWSMNGKRLGQHRNRPAANVLGGLTVAIVTGLAIWNLWRLLPWAG